jgi:hypothetical protein
MFERRLWWPAILMRGLPAWRGPVGDRIQIGGRTGVVRRVEPLLGGDETRLVVQLLPDRA